VKKIVFLIAVMANVSVAVDLKSIYADKEIREMAVAYKTVENRPDNFNAIKNIDLMFMSREFRGYVGAVLDGQEMFKECAKTHTLQDITYKTALVVESFDINETAPSAITMLVSISSACDDTNWKR
jgi:hypothetical protein